MAEQAFAFCGNASSSMLDLCCRLRLGRLSTNFATTSPKTRKSQDSAAVDTLFPGCYLRAFSGYEQGSFVPNCTFFFREILPTRVKHHLSRFLPMSLFGICCRCAARLCFCAGVGACCKRSTHEQTGKPKSPTTNGGITCQSGRRKVCCQPQRLQR
jgi:hypothetical protein